jgi:1-deoxy-D-xylulose-5-phosphate reductoisomerase
MRKKVAILGVTGSIGKSALEVLRSESDRFEPVLFSSHTNVDGLLPLGREFPKAVLVLSGHNQGIEQALRYGRQELLQSIRDSGADIVVNGITGATGLVPSLVSLESGADLALANKETIVMAAPLVFAAAAKGGGKIIPIDSEHSAIFNLINAHGIDRVAEILLTASGGPFRKYPAEALITVTPEEALVHPTWKMGPKITIDSATLANKGLEVIEAVGLFTIPVDHIRVVVHPQSIVHSMIRLTDGAVYAQLSKPDIRLSIHEALNFPECVPSTFGRLEFDALTLEFEKPDGKKFPMLPLAYEAVRSGGIIPAVYNAANEVAVSAFLTKNAAFPDIPRIVETVLNTAWTCPRLDLPSILEADAKARQLAHNCVTKRACAS